MFRDFTASIRHSAPLGGCEKRERERKAHSRISLGNGIRTASAVSLLVINSDVMCHVLCLSENIFYSSKCKVGDPANLCSMSSSQHDTEVLTSPSMKTANEEPPEGEYRDSSLTQDDNRHS